MTIKTDILVVGAGPAGSSAAKHAAKHGVEVVMIDRKSEIGSPKRCAEGASKESLEELGIKPNPRWIARELSGVRLVAPDQTSVWLDENTIKLPEAGYVLERKVFDKHMAMDAARVGTKIMIRTEAVSLKRTDDGFSVEIETMGKKDTIETKMIIAADGPESRIGRMAGLKCNTPLENMESGIQYEMAGLEMENNNCIQFYFGSVAPGGYAWIFPKGDDIANVGLGILTDKADKTAKEYLDDFVKNCPETKNAQAVEMNVGGVPVGGVVEESVGDNIIVVGDAAGHTNPFTGGGINSSLESGVYAGTIAAGAIQEGDCSKFNLKDFEKLVNEGPASQFEAYIKAKDYLLTLDDDEFNKIAEEFAKADLDRISPKTLIKLLIKVSPKALLKLGKLF
ncbi:MAG: NAD(P)/FAD-dependent oxidoreductase [Methanobacteriaceae archaeon]|nr:NAD(P)/FAD-dependent oxidoreductase [Methanobacteriaceae archaeon]